MADPKYANLPGIVTTKTNEIRKQILTLLILGTRRTGRLRNERPARI